jgi:hypothetical protein
MKYLRLSAALVLLITACNSEKKEETNEQVKPMEALYNFAETQDPNFCDTNAILGGDCGFGYLYLNQKGEAIYNSFCMGQDSTSFSIGTYTITDSTLVCAFSKDYCYYSCDGCSVEVDTLPSDPNSGKLHLSSQWTLKLQKLSCKAFEYGRRNSPEEQAEIDKEVAGYEKEGVALVKKTGYAFSRVNDKELQEFKGNWTKIKALEGYLKP